MNANQNAQLELTLQENALNRSARRRPRVSRAQWWFNRMRQVVDAAFEWQPVSGGRPEQMLFPGAHRQPLSEIR